MEIIAIERYNQYEIAEKLGQYTCPVCSIQHTGFEVDYGWVYCPLFDNQAICFCCCINHMTCAQSDYFDDHPDRHLFDKMAQETAKTVNELRNICVKHQETADGKTLPPEDDEFLECDPVWEDMKFYYAGITAYEQNDLDKAYKLLTISAELTPHAKTYERLFTVTTAMGKHVEAFEHIKTAYTLNPKANKIATIYADVLISENKVVEARAILNDVLSQNSTYGPARRLLEQLDRK